MEALCFCTYATLCLRVASRLAGLGYRDVKNSVDEAFLPLETTLLVDRTERESRVQSGCVLRKRRR